jgi:transposase
MQLRKTKTDKKDAVVIGRFLLANGATLIKRVTPALISDMRELRRQRESLVDEMTSLKIEVMQILNITFPKEI